MARVSKKKQNKRNSSAVVVPKYPRHDLERALRIPKGILDQNAGQECTEQEAARYIGVKYNRGPYSVEVSSAAKFGLVSKPASGRLALTDLARKILKPQSPSDKLSGLREAVLRAPEISDVYNHYRNENLPDAQFFENAITDRFNIPSGKVSEFKDVFLTTLRYAQLLEEHDGKQRVIDATEQLSSPTEKSATLKRLEKEVKVVAGDTCFVMMPFALPIGSYYEKIYAPAIEKAGLRPLRADDEIFKTGKIIDQIWSGIQSSKVLIAELTGRNPNVYYELGLAHASGKPVVLVCSSEADVPFDLRHIRVIYYETTDPFWGQKLIDKIAENVLSAIQNPAEVVFQTALRSDKT